MVFDDCGDEEITKRKESNHLPCLSINCGLAVGRQVPGNEVRAMHDRDLLGVRLLGVVEMDSNG